MRRNDVASTLIRRCFTSESAGMTKQSTRILHNYNALVYINLYNLLIKTKQVRMASKCHNHRPQTNTRHHKDEALEHKQTMTYTLKQNLLYLPQQDDCKIRVYTKNYMYITKTGKGKKNRTTSHYQQQTKNQQHNRINFC